MNRKKLTYVLFWNLLIALAYVAVVVFALSSSGCKTGGRPPRPSIAIIDELLHDNPQEAYYELCRDELYVVVDIDSPRGYDRMVHEACQYWNTALGYEALIYAGPTHVKKGERNYPYITVSMADLATEEEWDDRKERRHAETCTRKDCGKPPTMILGHFRGWHVDRSTSIYIGSTKVTASRVPRTGRTLWCTEGGEVLYRQEAAETAGREAATITHELGHILGFKHSKSPGTVMAPVMVEDTAEDMRLGDDTIAELYFLYGSDL